MKLLNKILTVCLLIPMLAWANEAGVLDHAPDRSNNLAALQNGAKLFVNYCLNCHSASAMRYSRLKELGLTEQDIKNNLLFTGDKVGDLMKINLSPTDAKAWFGVVPPDLSVIARAKSSSSGTGADWLYTYLRAYYKDDTPTGWNNLVFPNVGMPHVLWELQGIRTAIFEEVANPHGVAETHKVFKGFKMETPGQMTEVEYDNAVADLVAYLSWMGEPIQNTRKRLGVWVLLWMALLSLLAWRLSASYWKEVK